MSGAVKELPPHLVVTLQPRELSSATGMYLGCITLWTHGKSRWSDKLCPWSRPDKECKQCEARLQVAWPQVQALRARQALAGRLRGQIIRAERLHNCSCGRSDAKLSSGRLVPRNSISHIDIDMQAMTDIEKTNASSAGNSNNNNGQRPAQ